MRRKGEQQRSGLEAIASKKKKMGLICIKGLLNNNLRGKMGLKERGEKRTNLTLRKPTERRMKSARRPPEKRIFH